MFRFGVLNIFEDIISISLCIFDIYVWNTIFVIHLFTFIRRINE